MWKTIREATQNRTQFARLCVVLVLLIALAMATR